MNIDSVNRVDRAAFISAFGEIFEHSPWVAERTCAARPFASIDALHVAMVNTVKAAPQTEQLALLRDDMGSIKGRLTSMDARMDARLAIVHTDIAATSESLDRLENRLERIETRLGLIDA